MPKNQKIKNLVHISLDIIHLKICAKFFINLTIQWLKLNVPVEKNAHFLNYGISLTFREKRAYVPTLSDHISAMKQAFSVL